MLTILVAASGIAGMLALLHRAALVKDACSNMLNTYEQMLERAREDAAAEADQDAPQR